MRKHKLIIAAFVLSLSVLWLLADDLLFTSYSIESLSESLMQYTGLLAIGAMSFTIILAARPTWLTPLLGGLDKAYSLHKWLGISAFVFSFAHWLWAELPIFLGWLDEDTGEDADQLGTISLFYEYLSDFAREYAITVYPFLVLLSLVALVKLVPYKWFIKTHRLLAFFYIGLVIHAIGLMDLSYYLQPIGMITMLLLALGTHAAFKIIFNRVGTQKMSSGVIQSLVPFVGAKMLQVTIRLDERWQGHRAGQFAFVRFTGKERAHPFTISTAWDQQDRHVGFTIKQLGDYTNNLHEILHQGEVATVEGPYGCFTFDDTPSRQIWIGGGVGVTPFLARLEELGKAGNHMPIDFFYSMREEDDALEQHLRSLATQAHVNLHEYVTTKDGRISGELIRQHVENWESASIWFCGPKALGKSLEKDLVSHGLPRRHFHRELFEMR